MQKTVTSFADADNWVRWDEDGEVYSDHVEVDEGCWSGDLKEEDDVVDLGRNWWRWLDLGLGLDFEKEEDDVL